MIGDQFLASLSMTKTLMFDDQFPASLTMTKTPMFDDQFLPRKGGAG